MTGTLIRFWIMKAIKRYLIRERRGGRGAVVRDSFHDVVPRPDEAAIGVGDAIVFLVQGPRLPLSMHRLT
jgi:hypothetical protein